MRDLVLRAALMPGRPPLAGHHRRGRRPAHRAGLQRAAQGDRGAHGTAPSGCSARPPSRTSCRRSAPAAGWSPSPRRPPRTSRGSWSAATACPSRWRRTPPAPARATSAAPARWPATRAPATAAARWSSYPARLTSLGACMTAAANLAEVTKEEADLVTSELDAREKADLDTAYGVVERGRRPREYAPGPLRAREGSAHPRQAAPPRHGRPRADGPGLGLPRRDRGRHRRAGDAGQRGDPRRRRDGRPDRHAGAQPAADRRDLRRARADAGVQCAGGLGARGDDGGAQDARQAHARS